jgi:hypothetical protein
MGEAYAPAFLVDFAELTDHITGSNGVKKGWLSFNPDEAQHILSGYFGGLYTTVSQPIDSAYKSILPDEDVKMRDISACFTRRKATCRLLDRARNPCTARFGKKYPGTVI